MTLERSENPSCEEQAFSTLHKKFASLIWERLQGSAPSVVLVFQGFHTDARAREIPCLVVHKSLAYYQRLASLNFESAYF